jgi:hypothetical protein
MEVQAPSRTDVNSVNDSSNLSILISRSLLLAIITSGDFAHSQYGQSEE